MYAVLFVGAVLVLVALSWIRFINSPDAQPPEREFSEATTPFSPTKDSWSEAPPVDEDPVQHAGDDETISPLGSFPEKESSVEERFELPTVGEGHSWIDLDDPTKDGWDTEAFSAQANQQLTQVGDLIAGTEEIDTRQIAALITADFTGEALLPEKLSTVFEDQDLTVERSPSNAAASHSGRNDNSRQHYRGLDGFIQALRAASQPFQDARDVHFKFKVFRVESLSNESLSNESLSNTVLTRQYFAVSGRTATGTLEQHATWLIRWTPRAAGQLPLIHSIRVEDFEQAKTRLDDQVLFADCTASVLGNNPCYREQFLRGFNHWLNRIQESRYLALLANPGIAVGDVNNDGLDDLYVCQETGLPNRLFIQQTDGSALDVSERQSVNWLESSRSALWVDLDNDSDQDLVVAMMGGVAVVENNGTGQFRLRDVVPTTEDTMSLAAADYDQDGRLDLYVCAYYPNELLLSEKPSSATGLPGVAAGTVLHDANNGGANSLLRNEISTEGDWKFRDVTADLGLDIGNYRYSFAAVWEDYDNDGDQDLYVANDFGPNNLYRNDQLEDGTQGFVEVSAEAGAEDRAFGMSVSWGDFNRDGWMDLYVGNMFSAAGNRITYQNQFKPDATLTTRQRFQYLARGNTLLQNDGQGGFADVTEAASVLMGRWSWGSLFVDLNNDGWEDLFVTNGFITNDDQGDL